MSKSLSECTSLSWDAMLKITKKVQEVEFLAFLLDIAKPTINI